jgi:hypothetical protein
MAPADEDLAVAVQLEGGSRIVLDTFVQAESERAGAT